MSWEHWTAVTGRARAEFATLVRRSTPTAWCVGATVSGLIAQVAAAIPDGSRVLAPEPEFTSLLFPFLAQAERGVTVDVVPLDRLAEAIDASVDVVAVSAVQSSTGEVAALDDIAAAARHHGASTVIDATHAIGWLPVDATRFDAARLRRLQVADEPARHRVHGPRRGARRPPHAAPGRAGSPPPTR